MPCIIIHVGFLHHDKSQWQDHSEDNKYSGESLDKWPPKMPAPQPKEQKEPDQEKERERNIKPFDHKVPGYRIVVDPNALKELKAVELSELAEDTQADDRIGDGVFRCPGPEK
jgi:hypothetical protein